MTTTVTALWTHGNTVVAEHPEHLIACGHKGWGPEFQLRGGTRNWFHIAIPTPVLLADQHAQLSRVFLCFNTPEGDGHISEIHLYDGSNRIEAFEHLNLAGDHRAFLMNGQSAFSLPRPQSLYWGLSISFLYQAVARPQEPYAPSYLSIAAAGGEFLVDQHSQLQEEVQARGVPIQKGTTSTAPTASRRRRKPEA